MKRTKHEMTGFRGRQCKPDCIHVSHLTHQDNIWIFTQRRSQRCTETLRVAAHFTLVDQTVPALMHEFNRILKGQDVGLTIGIDVVDFPDPVGPVTNTSPRGRSASFLNKAGALIASSVSTSRGITRKAAAGPRA